MHRFLHQARRAALGGAALALIVVLGACGGGGGGSDSAPPVRTSLVPIPPAPGAQLYADASVLRPIADGASWTYDGTHTPATGAAVAYDNLVVQGAQGTNVVSESATNLFDAGASTVQVQVAAGVVLSTAYDYSGNPLPALAIELASPVRVGDQFTIDEATIADSGFDFDGDGKRDAVDYAIYRSVIGNETLTLPNLGTFTALHVDTYYRIRFISSSNGAVSPITQVVQSTWYVAGIGIVRQRLTTPTSSGVNEVWDEVLNTYAL